MELKRRSLRRGAPGAAGVGYPGPRDPSAHGKASQRAARRAAERSDRGARGAPGSGHRRGCLRHRRTSRCAAPREGSKQLYKAIRRSSARAGVAMDVHLETLNSADAAFAGNGPDGDVLIGIELKKPADCMACKVDGRFSGHQLLQMAEDYDVCELLVEGIFRPEPSTGVMQIKCGDEWRSEQLSHRVYMYWSFIDWLMTIQPIRIVAMR